MPPTPHTHCSLKVFCNLIATYNVGMIIKETRTMQQQQNCPTVSELRFLNKILIGSKFVKTKQGGGCHFESEINKIIRQNKYFIAN